MGGCGAHPSKSLWPNVVTLTHSLGQLRSQGLRKIVNVNSLLVHDVESHRRSSLMNFCKSGFLRSSRNMTTAVSPSRPKVISTYSGQAFISVNNSFFCSSILTISLAVGLAIWMSLSSILDRFLSCSSLSCVV